MQETTRVAVEDEQNAELRYRNLFENAVHGVFCCTQSGRFIEVNNSLAKMHGYDSPKEMMDSAQNCERYYVQQERLNELLEILGKCDYVKDFEFQAYRKDGSKVWLSQNTRVMRGLDSQEIYFDGIVQDISSRKRVEEGAQRRTGSPGSPPCCHARYHHGGK
jgi:PAS domain S-box-containing protein